VGLLFPQVRLLSQKKDDLLKDCGGGLACVLGGCTAKASSVAYLPLFAFQALHLARCAAAILALADADILRRARVGLVPAYAPTKALSAAFNPDNCRSTRSRSFLSYLTTADRFAIWVGSSSAPYNNRPHRVWHYSWHERQRERLRATSPRSRGTARDSRGPGGTCGPQIAKNGKATQDRKK